MWNPLRDFVAFVFPPFCPICKRALRSGERIVCEDCYGSVSPIAPPFCQTCGRPLKGSTRGYCRRCRGRDSPLRRARGLGAYAGVVVDLVQSLKYGRKPSIACRMGVMMGNLALYDPVLRAGELLIPVPLHPARLRERGYNQAERLARSVSQTMRIPISSRSLIRRRATKTQTLLGEEERRENVKGAFLVVREEEVRGKKVILVDDVLTSGATLTSAASALLEAGAKEVYGLVYAVAPAK